MMNMKNACTLENTKKILKDKLGFILGRTATWVVHPKDTTWVSGDPASEEPLPGPVFVEVTVASGGGGGRSWGGGSLQGAGNSSRVNKMTFTNGFLAG